MNMPGMGLLPAGHTGYCWIPTDPVDLGRRATWPQACSVAVPAVVPIRQIFACSLLFSTCTGLPRATRGKNCTSSRLLKKRM
ncbi:hypothetical protein ARTSIC4J27_2164 [Pseudarthrobacter siccitolerans]|uniref:Uncharacterized protein n=1 Tax=Pseudarthrobacter siccitolerans TaxID=861266 RepID=A0A024H1Y5_9MICC|nr:hypothetical protein ARTSIC4J27_2164 [Pseudarthrobacter siccitolerans]